MGLRSLFTCVYYLVWDIAAVLGVWYVINQIMNGLKLLKTYDTLFNMLRWNTTTQSIRVCSIDVYFLFDSYVHSNIKSYFFFIRFYIGMQINRSLDLTTHTSLSPIRRGFAPGFVNYKKGALDSQPQVLKFTSYLPMVGGSLRVLRLPPSLKLVAMI